MQTATASGCADESARSWSAANGASRCSPAISTIPRRRERVVPRRLVPHRRSRAIATPTAGIIFDGRTADVLKVAGENVSTVEVEQVLSRIPSVLEAAVVGQPDEIRDEVPVGFVVAHDPADPPDVRRSCTRGANERLAKSKRPATSRSSTELPRTSVGKIRKFLLRDAGRTRAAEQARPPHADMEMIADDHADR